MALTSTSSSTSATAGSSAFTMAPPMPISTHRDPWDIVLAFFREKAKDVSKVFGYTCGWLVEAMPQLPPNVKSFGTLMGQVKNFISATEFPEKTDKVVKAVKDFFSHPSVENARTILKEGTSWINSTCDGIDLGSQFIPITAEVMRMVKGINFSATLFGSGNGMIQNYQDVDGLTEYNAGKTVNHLIKLAADVSYFILGGVGLFFIVTSTPFIPWVMLTCLTSGLTFTIGGFFYERIVDPNGKHADPNKVIYNLQNQNAYQQDEITHLKNRVTATSA